MYVPDITNTPSCNVQQYDYIPHNVTRAPQLPPSNFNRIGLAPWFSVDCTQAYLNAARFDPIRAFIFYKPDNSTDKPPGPSDDAWDLEDRGAWRDSNFPIFAIPGLAGERMMEQLSLYSGSVLEVPNGKELIHYAQSPQDYVRIWTTLNIHPPKSSYPIWVYFLIVIGALIGVFAIVCLFLHVSQRRRRASLRRRVESGEVDLEAMGIKRLAVPAVHVKNFPLFTYTSTPIHLPRTPTAESVVASSKSTRSSSRRGLSHDHRVDSLETGHTGKTLRSQRSAINGEIDTIASNYQPHCHICLEAYDDRITIIRELSCHHIFHPVCIDEFLTRNSSLCPICKQSMLPRGFCPKITNSMVRRERALRKLRQQVEIDEESITSERIKQSLWNHLRFRRHPKSDAMNDYQMSSMEEDSVKGPSPDSSSNEPHSPSEPSSPDAPATVEPVLPQKPSATKKKAKTKGPRPRPISVMPTQPEEAVLKTTGTVGRHSPSSFARERMREIADKNAPFEDPDLSRPACKFHVLWCRYMGISKLI